MTTNTTAGCCGDPMSSRCARGSASRDVPACASQAASRRPARAATPQAARGTVILRTAGPRWGAWRTADRSADRGTAAGRAADPWADRGTAARGTAGPWADRGTADRETADPWADRGTAGRGTAAGRAAVPWADRGTAARAPADRPAARRTAGEWADRGTADPCHRASTGCRTAGGFLPATTSRIALRRRERPGLAGVGPVLVRAPGARSARIRSATPGAGRGAPPVRHRPRLPGEPAGLTAPGGPRRVKAWDHGRRTGSRTPRFRR